MKIGDKVYLKTDTYWFTEENQGQDDQCNQIEGIIIESGSSFSWKVQWDDRSVYYYDTTDLELVSNSNNYEIY